jgi:hypothetical protein
MTAFRADDPILNGIAVVIWGENWARHAEEHGCRDLSGKEILEEMPELPDEAFLVAAKILGHIEQANQKSVHVLLDEAARADGRHGRKIPYKYATEFGSDLGMMAMGTGVSWFDDHEEFPLEVPEIGTSDLQAIADERCEVNCQSCGADKTVNEEGFCSKCGSDEREGNA